jgi:UPF0176 protein
MYTNVSLYKFKELQNLQSLKDDLLSFSQPLEMKGTVLIAKEGINACLAGTKEAIEMFVTHLKNYFDLDEDDLKYSMSDFIPFKLMVVKVSKDTIPGDSWISKPFLEAETASHVDALTLKQWLDEKKDIVILDTRNDYEYEVGKFKGAINPKLKHFRYFPQWLQDNLSQYKDKTIVTYCTGGIRCEKATAYMKEQGFQDVYQLKGGILKYFEEVNKVAKEGEPSHYDGSCFVFDYRIAVDQNLNPTSHEVCFRCWGILTPESKSHPLYVKGLHCQHCYDKYQAKQERIEKIKAEKKQAYLAMKAARTKAIQEGTLQVY